VKIQYSQTGDDSVFASMTNIFFTREQVLRSENHLRNADVELQQRAVEYMQLSSVATTDVLATVLEEMPPFPERESSILAMLKKRRPDKVNNVEIKVRLFITFVKYYFQGDLLILTCRCNLADSYR